MALLKKKACQASKATDEGPDFQKILGKILSLA